MSSIRSEKFSHGLERHFQFSPVDRINIPGSHGQPQWVYKKGTQDEIKICLSECPQTSADYYELAMALLYHSTYKNKPVWLNSHDHYELPKGSSEEDIYYHKTMRAQRDVAEHHYRNRVHQADRQFMADCKKIIDSRESAADVNVLEFEVLQAREKEMLALREAKHIKEEHLFRVMSTENLLTRCHVGNHPSGILKEYAKVNYKNSNWDFLELTDQQVKEAISQRTKIAAHKQLQFINSLLIEAAIAGHPKASEELDFILLSNKDNFKINIVRKFTTVDELEKLATDLKNNGGCGTYYLMENIDEASALSLCLFKVVADMRSAEKAACDLHSVEQGLSSLSLSVPSTPVAASARAVPNHLSIFLPVTPAASSAAATSAASSRPMSFVQEPELLYDPTPGSSAASAPASKTRGSR